MVLLAGSITGVPLMPTSGVRSTQPVMSVLGTEVPRFTCQSGAEAATSSASNA